MLRAAEVLAGSGTFLREPFNRNEREEFIPKEMRSLSVTQRVGFVLDNPTLYLGIKHIYSPFVSAEEKRENLNVIRTLLIKKRLRVLLITRRNIERQFISLEIAHQTNDWWNYGPQALPKAIGLVQAGCSSEIGDAEIFKRLKMLSEATELLRNLLKSIKVQVSEVAYEEIFDENPLVSAKRLASALKHFRIPMADPPAIERLSNLVKEGSRFEALLPFYAALARRHPTLARAIDR